MERQQTKKMLKKKKGIKDITTEDLEPTGMVIKETGRPVFKSPAGMHSEIGVTLEMGGKFVNIPSIQDGKVLTGDELADGIKSGKLKPTGVYDKEKEAHQASRDRSDSLTSERIDGLDKPAMQEGGLLQEGGTVDPVSGNDVPVGSTQEEVRDDIPAQLSEGEFVFPADVVRFIGLDNLMKLRQEAKSGLAKMDRMGQMGNSEEAVEDDTGEFDTDIDDIIGEIEREARMAEPEEEEQTEEEPPVKKSDEERLGFNTGGLGTTDDSSENKKTGGKNMAMVYEKDNAPDAVKKLFDKNPETKDTDDKKDTEVKTTPVVSKADTKSAAMNILGKKYDVSTKDTGVLGSQQLAQNILEKKYGKGVTAKRIAGIEDIEKSATGSVKDRSTLESTYTMTKDEYSKLDQAGAQDHIYNQILNQNNIFLADQGVNYQGKQGDKEFIFRHMAKDLAAAGIKDLRQLGSKEVKEDVSLVKKKGKYYQEKVVNAYSGTKGLVKVDPKKLSDIEVVKGAPSTVKAKMTTGSELINKETGEKVVQGKYGGNLTEYQKEQGFRWGNTTSVEGMADYMISFDDKGQPLVYPRYEDTTSGFVAPLLKGAMLAATIYGGYALANTFATQGFAAGAKQVGKKFIKKQVSKALSKP